MMGKKRRWRCLGQVVSDLEKTDEHTEEGETSWRSQSGAGRIMSRVLAGSQASNEVTDRNLEGPHQ